MTQLRIEDVLERRNNMKILCQEPIPLPGNSNTYCMLEKGHDGPHHPLAARITSREEMALIPEGCSVTETEVAWYLRARREDHIITIRVPKDDFYSAVVTINQLTQINPKNWHGVFGTNG